MNKMMEEAPQSFRGRLFQTDDARPKEQRILVLKTGIAGLNYYIESEEEKKALGKVKPGTELLLFREPDNEHDEWAIAVYLTKDDKIGFISRFKNEAIARLMDVGKRFIAVVDDPEKDEEARAIQEKEQKKRRKAPTENMAFPFSIYLIEDGE